MFGITSTVEKDKLLPTLTDTGPGVDRARGERGDRRMAEAAEPARRRSVRGALAAWRDGPRAPGGGRGVGGSLAPGSEQTRWRPAALQRGGLTHPISGALPLPRLLRRGLWHSLSARLAAAPRAAHAVARARPAQPRRCSIPRAALLLPPPPGGRAGGG